MTDGIQIIRNQQIPFKPASHEDPNNPGAIKKVLLDRGYNLKGILCMVNWARMEVGHHFKAHYHEDMTEVFIIITGIAEISGTNYNEQVTEGDCIIVPMQTVHSMKNIGNTLLEYIVFGLANQGSGQTVIV
jgi:quercetin dioxygenase-like cupin family protein